MGNSLTNNLPTSLDQFLMDMAQTVGPFDYGDVIKFADRIVDVKTDKNIATIRKLYAKAKEAAEYDDDEEFAVIGEDLNDIITGVKDFNQPGTLFADTKTFKYEDSQNSEYNDLGTDTRTGERFPEPLEDDYEETSPTLDDDDWDETDDPFYGYGEDDEPLTEDCDHNLDDLVGKKVKCIKGASHPNMGKLFDKGRSYTISGKTDDGRLTVGGVHVGEEFFKEHFELEDSLDESYEDIYSATFKAKGFVNQMRKSYDDATIKMAVENCLKESIKINEDEDEDEDEESGFVRDFVDELVANGLTDEVYEQVTKGRNYSDYQLELVDDAIRHFIDDWKNDSGDVEAETAEEAKQIILDSIGDYLEPNLPEEVAEEDDKKASIENWDKKDQETYKAALKLLGKKRELTKSEKKFIKETCYYIYSSLGRQLTDEELKLYCEFASGYDMSVLKDEDWTTKEWAESFVKDDIE